MPNHIEGLTRRQALAAIAVLDLRDGYPAKLTGSVALSARVSAACDAWLASNRTATPPPGITLNWDQPAEHPTKPGNFSLAVANRHVSSLVGRFVDGKLINRGDIRVRTAAERREWRRQDDT